MSHILIAEDDFDVRDVLTTLLGLRGHTHDVAENGRQAADMIWKSDTRYDVIITDLVMPGMSGSDLLAEVRQRIELQTPIIIMSGHAHMIEALDELRRGAFSVLQKPFELAHMDETIEQALKLRSAFLEMERLKERVADLTELREDLYRRNQELYESARLDPLTALPNRLQMDALLNVYSANATRYASSFAVAFCDIDKFGRFNSTFGWPVGDRVLLKTVEVIKSCCRDGDSLFRWGGDEFVLILAGQDLDGAGTAMQRIVDKMSTTRIAVNDEGVEEPVTMSVGLAAVSPGESRTIQELIDEASQQLLLAKAAGARGECPVSPAPEPDAGPS